MKISELKSPWKELAELRRKEHDSPSKEDDLVGAFGWVETDEGGEFWAEVSLGGYPEIPQEPLKELEAKKLIPDFWLGFTIASVFWIVVVLTIDYIIN
ncbi:MAG: hypothetical protein WD512_05660 [Candidatus Paceibacterota bacterium]